MYTQIMKIQDGNGMVSTSEIKFVLTRLGVELSDEELGEMVQVNIIRIVMVMILSNSDYNFYHVLPISIFMLMLSGGRHQRRSTCQL